MITLTFKKHIVDKEYQSKGFTNVKDYCLSMITVPYQQIRFCEVENLGQALDGIFWYEGKTKMCNNKVYQIQILK